MPEEAIRDQAQPTHVEEVTPIEWIAPGRPFQKRGKQFYLTGLLIMLLVEIILFLFSQYMLMVLVLSLVFVSFALAAIPPKDFHYRMSSEGIRIEDTFFLWKELYDFYFKKEGGMDTLHVRTQALLPGELILTLGSMEKEKVKKTLFSYLPFREFVKPSFMEKSGDWLSKNFPLENK
jgi:hypothetical protein